MTILQNLRNPSPSLLKFVSLLCQENNFKPSRSDFYVNGPGHILQILRCCSTERAVNLKSCGNPCELPERSHLVRIEAQDALLDYLHSTRSLQFSDAENMSKNTPHFLDRLVKRVDYIDESDVGRSLTRFLRYHPINEFEPFFESIGLDPFEYASFLPKNLIFLSDDQLLLENYYVLCDYGIARNRIGKIYKEAPEVFRYDYGVLQAKLKLYQSLGLKQSLFVKIIASSPYLLKEGVNRELLEFVEKLKHIGIEYDRLEELISEGGSYNWKRMLKLMDLLGRIGLTRDNLGEVISRHPDLLLEHSGRNTFCLLGLLLKFGSTQNAIQSVFLEFPNMSVVKFTSNLLQCYNFLVEIKMSAQDIGKLCDSHTLLLGSCELKRVQTLMRELNCEMSQLCRMIKEDPNVLKKWVVPNRVLEVKLMKTKFLLSLGFVEHSKDIERALEVCRGKAEELQERFDCLVKCGLSREEVIKMVKVFPMILNQSKDVIEKKIGCFVNDLGYPVSCVVNHPALVNYTIERVKLRLLMYKWLRDERVVHQKLSLSTLLQRTEEIFVTNYVNSHPKGAEVWERLKKEIYSAK